MGNAFVDAARVRAVAAVVATVVVATLLVTASAASAATGDPIGSFDVLRVDGSGSVIEGWAADPDAPGAPVELHVYVNGSRRLYGTMAEPRLVTTGEARPDVAAAHPWAGSHAGFAHHDYVEPGSTVCVYAINQLAEGQNTTLGCRVLDPTATANDPVGSLDEVWEVAPGLVHVRGWAGDADTTSPLTVHVGLLEAPSFYNRSGVSPYAQTSTGDPRPDVAQVFPAVGGQTGFDAPFALGTPGTYTVCAWAINAGPGSNNTTIGCRDVRVTAQGRSPIVGRYDATLHDTDDQGHPIPATTRVAGWAFDTRHPDRPVTIRVRHLRFAGSGQRPELAETGGVTGVRRDDVAAAVPGAGPNQGFAVPVESITSSGIRPPRLFFAVYAVDPDGGPDVLLGYVI